MSLTDIAIRQTRSTGKAYTLSDGRGLALYVTASGSKSWHFRYRWLDKQRRMSFGSYPEVSLKEARIQRERPGPWWPKAQQHHKQERLVRCLAEEQCIQGIFDHWIG